MRYLAITALLFFIACSNHEQSGGVCFTFDDQHIEEWVKHAPLFDRYNVKATFFVNRPHLLDSNQIAGLQYLSRQGHEIGSHGYNHVNATTYADSVEAYLTDEVLPAISVFRSLGINVCSHAYPFGAAPIEIDSMLLGTFKYLRKATWNREGTTLDKYDEIFASKGNFRVVNSMGIDYNYKIDIESIRAGLRRAKKRNEVLVFHAHKIDTLKADYRINPEYLETIFILCQGEGVQPIRMMDLGKKFGNLEIN